MSKTYEALEKSKRRKERGKLSKKKASFHYLRTGFLLTNKMRISLSIGLQQVKQQLGREPSS